MKTHTLTLIASIAISFGVSIPAHAASHAAAAPLATNTAAPMVSAEIRKVDRENKKITLKHGEIKNLDMPPMTMVFKVMDAAMLDKVQAGDKVMFSAEKIDGAYTVTVMEALRPDAK